MSSTSKVQSLMLPPVKLRRSLSQHLKEESFKAQTLTKKDGKKRLKEAKIMKRVNSLKEKLVDALDDDESDSDSERSYDSMSTSDSSLLTREEEEGGERERRKSKKLI